MKTEGAVAPEAAVAPGAFAVPELSGLVPSQVKLAVLHELRLRRIVFFAFFLLGAAILRIFDAIRATWEDDIELILTRHMLRIAVGHFFNLIPYLPSLPLDLADAPGVIIPARPDQLGEFESQVAMTRMQSIQTLLTVFRERSPRTHHHQAPKLPSWPAIYRFDGRLPRGWGGEIAFGTRFSGHRQSDGHDSLDIPKTANLCPVRFFHTKIYWTLCPGGQ
jgi:hypothetical protein